MSYDTSPAIAAILHRENGSGKALQPQIVSMALQKICKPSLAVLAWGAMNPVRFIF